MNKDCTFIVALQQSDQQGTGKAYSAMKEPFMRFLKQEFPDLCMDDKKDIYHDTFIRLQQNVLQGRLTPDNLNCSLQQYVNKIGRNVAKELLHQRQKICLGTPEWVAMTEDLRDQLRRADNYEYPLAALWDMEVEQPFSQFANTAEKPDRTACQQEYERLREAFRQKYHKYISAASSVVRKPRCLMVPTTINAHHCLRRHPKSFVGHRWQYAMR